MFEIGVEKPVLYGIVMLAGAAGALALGGCRSQRAGIGRGRIAVITALLPFCAALLSHFLYTLVDMENTLYDHSIGYALAFWEKGYMFTGGILGAALCLMVLSGKDRWVLMESYAAGGALMLMAARVAEGFLGQGYGEYYEGISPLCRFPFMVYDPYYEAWAWALFMLEALVALCLFLWLLKRKAAFPGDSALVLLGLYGSTQILLESLRRDEFLRWGFVRVEQVACAVLVLLVVCSYARRAAKNTDQRRPLLLCFALYVGMIILCVLLEFAMEGRIPFLVLLDVGGCYAAMAGACALLCACVLWMRSLACSAKAA